jgi:hypothetical protein
MCAQQPTLGQSGDAMNAWHTDVSRVASILKNNPVVFIAAIRGIVEAMPLIGQDLRTFLGNIAICFEIEIIISTLLYFISYDHILG